MSSTSLFSYFKELPSTTIVAFVKQNQEMSERMKNTYLKLKEITSAEIRRMSEEELLNINSTSLSHLSHIFILDIFSGNTYDHLVSKKCKELRIFGVPLVEKMISHVEDVRITKNWKIHNDTFQNLTICTSNLSSNEKAKIESLVKLMDGSFTNELSLHATHLITNSTKTVKYSDACTLDIPIYHTEWIHHIWNKWKKNPLNVPKADSSQYDVFKLPPLFDLKISLTGISNKKKREEISSLIEENGGKYEEIFKSNENDVLLMDKLDPENSKFKLATKCKIPVVNVNWVLESVKSGYALSHKDFVFKRLKSHDSSSSSSVSMSESSVNISADSKKDEKMTTIEETSRRQKSTVLLDKTNENFLTSFEIRQAKALGHILDGYVLYFYNFPAEYYFKVGKLVSACGGIRINEIDQSITHILCFNKENLDEFYKKTSERDFHGSMVDYKWLVECLKQGKLLSESDYIINGNFSLSKKIIPPSPLSQKAINSLNVSIGISTEGKKENAKIASNRKEFSGTSSKMLDFSSHEFVQPSIEANHKKIKQTPNALGNRKRSLDGDSNLNEATSKRRKVSDDAVKSCNKIKPNI